MRFSLPAYLLGSDSRRLTDKRCCPRQTIFLGARNDRFGSWSCENFGAAAGDNLAKVQAVGSIAKWRASVEKVRILCSPLSKSWRARQRRILNCLASAPNRRLSGGREKPAGSPLWLFGTIALEDDCCQCRSGRFGCVHSRAASDPKRSSPESKNQTGSSRAPRPFRFASSPSKGTIRPETACRALHGIP